MKSRILSFFRLPTSNCKIFLHNILLHITISGILETFHHFPTERSLDDIIKQRKKGWQRCGLRGNPGDN